MAKKKKNKYTSIGGQALMEGIMMRGPGKCVMACRRADGSIYLENVPLKKKTIWQKIPIVRGVFNFIDSMVSGSKTLMRSAEIAIEDEEAAERAAAEAAAKAEVSDSLGSAEETSVITEESAEETADIAEAVDETAEENVEEAVEEIAETAETVSEESAEIAEEIAETAEEISESAASAAVTPVEMLNPIEPEKIVPKNKKDKSAKKEEKQSDGLGEGFTFMSVLLGVALAMLLFVFLPTWSYSGILLIPGAAEIFEPNGEATVWKSVIEGVVKIIIFLVYILLCSTLKEIRRVFEYHGAEHKCIFC